MKLVLKIIAFSLILAGHFGSLNIETRYFKIEFSISLSQLSLQSIKLVISHCNLFFNNARFPDQSVSALDILNIKQCLKQTFKGEYLFLAYPRILSLLRINVTNKA
ncbi:hypothetical protein V1478_002236 [Vespula squamosa]|uniref:Uncharacterized protein n=1 Tax=Vespula squamosa TaxID=30214 RepID=A0ABD2BXK9_VESSQ